LKAGQEITPYYDSMLAKIIVHTKTREEALKKMSVALSEMKVSGVKTTISFFRKLIMNPEFMRSKYTTKFLETFSTEDDKEGVHFDAAAIIAALYYKKNRSLKGYSQTTKKKSSRKEDVNKWGLAGRSEAMRIRRGW
ncbi:MAG: hypothetical protein WCQ53_07860, partial [bacterium]